MQPLEPPDSHHLNAAIGWLELNNPAEAGLDLERISPELREHPMVLEVAWRVAMAAVRHEEALQLSDRLIVVCDDAPVGWINRSYTLHEMGRTREALDALLPVVDRFGGVSTIPYNIACYYCRLSMPGEAMRWLRRAIQIKGKEPIKKLALADPDLESMWGEIRSMG